MKMYRYFISYHFCSDDSSSGFGSHEIKINKPIKSYTELMEISHELAKELQKGQVVILYWKEF